MDNDPNAPPAPSDSAPGAETPVGSGGSRLTALRGAITVEKDDAALILEAASQLVLEVMERNALAAEDMVSCLFTCTEDLTAEFPAVAARQVGLSTVPLMCAREMAVPHSLPRVIRLMVHCYAPAERRPQHVYLREAAALRRDLEGAQ